MSPEVGHNKREMNIKNLITDRARFVAEIVCSVFRVHACSLLHVDFTRVYLRIIHRVPKKEATKLLAITFSNLNRLSNFFHC